MVSIAQLNWHRSHHQDVPYMEVRMKNTRTRRIIFATAGIAALALAACGNGGGGGGGGETTGGGGGGGDVSISFLTPNGATDVAIG
jgi:hypothetical protein